MVLHEFEGIEKNLDMFENAMIAESKILRNFGLQETSQNRGRLDLFCWAGEFEDEDIEKFYHELIATAENYLTAPVKSNIAFLNDAKDKHLTAYDVLPEMGIETNSNNVFLYESLFYCQNYPADLIFEEMNKGNTIPGGVVIDMNSPLLLKGNLDQEVSNIGLKFWDDFKSAEKTAKEKISQKSLQLLDRSRQEWPEVFPDIFYFTEGYVSRVRLIKSDEPKVYVEIATHFESKWLDINVYMPFDEVMTMLKKSSCKSNASMIRNMLFEGLGGNPFVGDEIPVREWYKTYLFCQGLDWTVVKMELEDEETEEAIDCHNNYTLIQY
jgi:hypothetical protein